jgi:CIC family chloride channel protein
VNKTSQFWYSCSGQVRIKDPGVEIQLYEIESQEKTGGINNIKLSQYGRVVMNRFRYRFSSIIDRLQPTETSILIVTAIVVGAGTGLGAVLFIKFIALINQAFFTWGAEGLKALGAGFFILAPAVGGLLAGPVIAYFAREAKGHGVPEVMQAIALRGGRIRPRVVVAKVIASALCIGSGGSAGREGPIVQVGSALGSTIGQLLHLSEARLRNLVACGSAAGIAATFNAPIAGVIFAMEIILGELHLGDLGNVIISAVTASTIARIFLGEYPAFVIPNYGIKSPWEVLLFTVLGLLAALMAVAFIRLLYWFEDRFDSWHFPDALKPAIGGLLLGVMAYGYLVVTRQPSTLSSTSSSPEIFGAGFATIESALLGELPLGMLLLLVLLKPLATAFTLGSGNSGGVFAPALFIGAALGGAFGKIVELVAPGITAGSGAFAIVGMAAVFAGAARAPFTAILIVFEMTNDYRLILPLMAGVIVSLILSERLHPESIYTLKLVRRGIRLKQGRDLDLMETVRVEEVMMRQPGSVKPDLPVTALAGEFLKTGQHGFPILDKDGSLYGMVSLDDYQRAVNENPSMAEKLLVRDIATRDVVSVFPDESVGTAMRRMAPRDLSRLPVVTREDVRRLVGEVRRNDIVAAYDIGSARREEARHRAEQTRAVHDARAQFSEVSILGDSFASGRTVAQLELPQAVVLVSIRRGRDLLIPRGETRLRAGDVVTILSERECTDQARKAFLKKKTTPTAKSNPPTAI